MFLSHISLFLSRAVFLGTIFKGLSIMWGSPFRSNLSLTPHPHWQPLCPLNRSRSLWFLALCKCCYLGKRCLSASVSKNYHNKTPQIGCLKQQKFIFHSSGIGSPRSGCQHGQALTRPWLGLQMAAFSLCPHKVKGEKPSLFLFIRALIPSRGPTFMTSSTSNNLTKAPFPNAIMFRVGASTCQFYGDTNIQFITPSYHLIGFASDLHLNATSAGSVSWNAQGCDLSKQPMFTLHVSHCIATIGIRVCLLAGWTLRGQGLRVIHWRTPTTQSNTCI